MEALSVCVITKNEEAAIGRCLSSVSFADELVVVDSGSTDRTVALAGEAGATVIRHDWPGWAAQKNYAIDAAANDWILSLDADEWLPEGAEAAIRRAIASGAADAYYLGRRTTFLGKWMAHGGWYPDRQIRLFRRSSTRFAEVPVHEKVSEPARHAILDLDIWHESYVSLEDYFQKNAAYTAAQARQQRDQRFLALKLLIKPPYRFFQTYAFQLGFLDGPAGLVLACLRAWYEWKVIALILAARRSPQA